MVNLSVSRDKDGYASTIGTLGRLFVVLTKFLRTCVTKYALTNMKVYWSDGGELVAIATDETFYVLRFNRAAYLEAVNAGTVDPNEGVEDAFEVVADIIEK